MTRNYYTSIVLRANVFFLQAFSFYVFSLCDLVDNWFICIILWLFFCYLLHYYFSHIFVFWVEGRICPDASMTFVWIFLFAWNSLITMIFHRFNLLYEECIEFNKLGLRDNVAQLCVLEVHNALILSSVLFNFCWDKLRMFNYLILHPLIDVPGFPSNIFILQIIYRNGSFPSR